MKELAGKCFQLPQFIWKNLIQTANAPIYTTDPVVERIK